MLILYRVELSKSSILTTFSKSRKINKKNLLSTNCETLFTPPPTYKHSTFKACPFTYTNTHNLTDNDLIMP